MHMAHVNLFGTSCLDTTKGRAMFIEVLSNEFRTRFRAYMDHHLTTGDRILVTRHGEPVGAWVSHRDFKRLEDADNSREEFLEHQHQQRMRDYRMLRDEQM
jgi:prevent-host-death family protein